ncbi:carboxylesterase/lipase family protein [Motilibacter rhizosphaerae]|uniref:carboxylesterase/lipase family protein n=1 Tax=Motilibacter rhizosphaerae TaxID=598652 RepID=UPI001E5452F0|nr:carboxylesterase family protein [Motilibacter rhizosphaerae]
MTTALTLLPAARRRRRTRARRLSALATATAALVVGAGALTPTTASAAPGPVVTTASGAVRGSSSGGVDAFLGIPYAAAPTGALRWKPPQPATPWPGTRDATAFGNPCPVLPSTNGPRSETEDCLVINVWRPAGVQAGARLPVHVFIHGGGLVNGSGAQNDETKLVHDTGVIGVSFNYRLGVFGFLGLPALTSEGGESGNYGFLDQQAALRWVQANIARFGGKPGAVTIDGESAGGFSVCGHLVAPGSRGLFKRAMIQSGSCPSITQARAEANGAAFAAKTGCAAGDLSCLRGLPVATLLDASSSFGPSFVSGTSTFPVAPKDAVAAGQFARVPILVGANRDEGRTFAQGFIGQGQSAYLAWVNGTFGSNAPAVLAHYPWPATSDQFTAAYLVAAVETDSGILAQIGGCGLRDVVRTFAQWTRTYAYEFDNRTGPGLVQIPGYVWGAGHAAELAYIWPSFNNGTPIAPLFNAGEQQLANEMTQYWGAFTKNGRPRVAGLPSWPRYDHRGSMISLRPAGASTTINDSTFSAEHQCSFWNSLPAQS